MAIGNSVDAGTAGYQSLTSAGVWNGRTFQAGAGISLTNADGTAGNTTITATGGSSGANAILDGFDDFLFNNSASFTQIGEANWIFTGTGAVLGTTVAGHPGIVTSKTTSALGLFKGFSLTGAGCLILGAGILTVTFYMRINSLTTFSVNVGLTDLAQAAGDAVNGVYFLGQNGLNSGNWVGKTANASTRSTANSSTAIGTGWTVLQIVVNAAASSVSFKVGATLSSIAEIANSPLTTNIPTGSLGINWGIANAGSGTVDLDLITWNYNFNTPR